MSNVTCLHMHAANNTIASHLCGWALNPLHLQRDGVVFADCREEKKRDAMLSNIVSAFAPPLKIFWGPFQGIQNKDALK